MDEVVPNLTDALEALKELCIDLDQPLLRLA